MAKKVRFPLKMADGAEVRTLEELKEHFDIASVVEYFSDGRLLMWLQARYYDEEADKVSKLSKDDDTDFYEKLCKIFGFASAEEVDPELIAWRQERLNHLKQYTDDEKILANVDRVAFNQEELADLLDDGVDEIYLCANRFVIPLRVENKIYVGVKDAVAVIRSKTLVDFNKLNIKFIGVKFDDYYQKILDASQPPPAKIKSPQTNNPLQSADDFHAEFERIEKTWRILGDDGIKKELAVIEKRIEQKRDAVAMDILADFYRRLLNPGKADECRWKAKSFSNFTDAEKSLESSDHLPTIEIMRKLLGRW